MQVVNQEFGDGWAAYQGDSAEILQGLPSQSVDLSVFSPPFGSLYTYSASERDLGNSRTPEEFWQHFSFISKELLRVMKPGRNICVHVADLSSTKAMHGVTGLIDFSGATIAHFVEAGFVYHGRITIDKNAQAQAIRTHSKALLFVQFRKDSIWSRPALPDYILVFRAPGENAVPVKPDVTNDEWIQWASPCWYDIRETDTLNAAEARSADDSRHVCPLQLGTIRRCVKLWSNPGETVLSPFMGISSEGVVSLEEGRRFIGAELKPEYFATGVKNLRNAERASGQATLFSLLDDEPEEVTA